MKIRGRSQRRGRGAKEDRINGGASTYSVERRLAEWRGLTKDQQIRSLDARLGVGVGAKRQREKLA